MSGYIEMDATGFHLFAFGGYLWLRHSCGDTTKLNDPWLSTVNTAVIVHRMEGCTAGYQMVCGECKLGISEDEDYRHNGNRWVHVKCPTPPPNRVETDMPQEGPSAAV